MNKDIEKFCEENRLLMRNKTVLVAFSGGADSSFLLWYVRGLLAEGKLDRVFAAHFNHHLRGAESDRDEGFCRGVCDKYGIELFLGGADTAGFAAKARISVEAAARVLRYEFLEKTAAELGAVILTAHNSDDNAETVLLNLLRGSGLRGLCGIPPARGNVERPLLPLESSAVRALCAENGIEYIEDSTNAEDFCSRNLLRHKVFPVLRGLNPSVCRSIQRSGQLLRQDLRYLESEARAALERARVADAVNTGVLNRLPDAVCSEALRIFLGEHGITASYEDTLRTMALVRGGGGQDTVCGLRLCCCKGVLSCTHEIRQIPQTCLKLGDNRAGNLIVTLTLNENKGENRKIHFYSSVSYDKIVGQLLLRGRRAGDYLRTAKGRGKSLKKLFNEKGVPPHRRESVAVICDDEGVVWVEGFGRDERVAADPATERVLEIKVTRLEE